MKSHVTLQVAAPAALGTVTAEEAELLAKLDLARLPRHVAVIMDGNGRWAQRKHLPRVAGHRVGTQTTRTTIETCARLKIEALTLYAFSVENWRRPKTETDFLMQLLREYLRHGDAADPAEQYPNAIFGPVQRTAGRCAARHEERGGEDRGEWRNGSVSGAELRRPRRDCGCGERDSGGAERAGQSTPITEEEVSRRLYTPGLPDPDLLIRTSGEMRVSNFLLWQIAYAEIFVTETLWPDFNRARLLESFVEFQKRERRYGGIREDGSSTEVSARVAGE